MDTKDGISQVFGAEAEISSRNDCFNDSNARFMCTIPHYRGLLRSWLRYWTSPERSLSSNSHTLFLSTTLTISIIYWEMGAGFWLGAVHRQPDRPAWRSSRLPKLWDRLQDMGSRILANIKAGFLLLGEIRDSAIVVPEPKQPVGFNRKETSVPLKSLTYFGKHHYQRPWTFARYWLDIFDLARINCVMFDKPAQPRRSWRIIIYIKTLDVRSGNR